MLFSPPFYFLLLQKKKKKITTVFIKLKTIKSLNNACAVRKESWTSLSFGGFLSRKLILRAKAVQSIWHWIFCRIYVYRIYSVFLKNKSVPTEVLVSRQSAWENDSISVQGSLDNNFIWWNRKNHTTYSIYFLASRHRL